MDASPSTLVGNKTNARWVDQEFQTSTQEKAEMFSLAQCAASATKSVTNDKAAEVE